MSKEKRPAYFRFFLEACDMISLLDKESAGRVIHAVSDYFAENVEPNGLADDFFDDCICDCAGCVQCGSTGTSYIGKSSDTGQIYFSKYVYRTCDFDGDYSVV